MMVLCQNDQVIRKAIEDMSDEKLPTACIRFVLDGTPNWIVGVEILADPTWEYMYEFIVQNTVEVEYVPPVIDM